MDQAHLRRLLTELHGELAHAKPVDARNRELLAQLATDIEALSGAPAAVVPERYRSVRGRLVEAATALEATHPTVASSLERVIDTLAFFNL